jgi:WD40 repeat protein
MKKGFWGIFIGFFLVCCGCDDETKTQGDADTDEGTADFVQEEVGPDQDGHEEADAEEETQDGDAVDIDEVEDIEPDELSGPPSGELLWEFHIPSGEGPIRNTLALGFQGQYILTGGWSGGLKMFERSGSGAVLWETDPNTSSGVAASRTSDIFYAASNAPPPGHEGDPPTFLVQKFHGDSSTPDWTYEGGLEGYTWAAMGAENSLVCTPDGQTLAVGCSLDGHLAILFFHPDSPTPFSTYEDTDYVNVSTVRLTEDGTTCTFLAGSEIYRLDVETAAVEGSADVDGTNYCLGVSPDGSVVVHGFQVLSVFEWDGSGYNLLWDRLYGTSIVSIALVARDNDQIFTVMREDDDVFTTVLKFSKAAGSDPEWTYETPHGSDVYQDDPSWAVISDDARLLAVSTWGTENNAFPEVFVLWQGDPTGPFFTIDTMGSALAVDITPDGHYLAALGKNVHSNVTGNGCDVYAAEILW